MKAKTVLKAAFLSLVYVLLLASALHAQPAGGSVTGTVTDVQGGVMSDATITLRGPDITKTFTTGADGGYRFLDLAPGAYTVSVERQGFTTIVRNNVIVEVGKNVDLPERLQFAPVAETVTVTAPSPMIDTKQTGTATNVTSSELTNIPTSRDPFSIMRTVPGVLVDRVNIAGNETGQQSNFVMKATRPQDAVWTLDGVNVTDMVLGGAAPTYFNFDNFEEIQFSTSGQDITQPTGGLGLNFIVKRGTNRFHGGVRGYFSNNSLQASNVPAELTALGVTPATADHVVQNSDWGGEFGGPIYNDHAWFYASFSDQDIRLLRHTSPAVDSTTIKNPNVKLTWQATKKDLVSFLYFDGYKIKDNRSPGTTGIILDAPTATFHQDNTYENKPLHGLWKWADDRVLTPNMFLSAKYAYYNNGFILQPEGGMGLDAGQDRVTGTSYGSTSQTSNLRPQQTANLDVNSFLNGLGGSHDVRYGFGFRRVDGTIGTLWPGDGILALRLNAATSVAEIFRQGLGTNRADYLDFYAGDTLSLARMTIVYGVRYDRQWGAALPATSAANPSFPTVVPGVVFAGYSSPFTWNNISPRAGFAYALDDARKTVFRTSLSRYASQLSPTTIGFASPTTNPGVAIYGWTDLNGNHLAEPNEVNLSQFFGTGNGFNAANPTAVISSNQMDPNLKSPLTTSFVAGVDRELRPSLAVQVNYTYTRVSNQFDDTAGNITPRVGLAPGINGNYTPGSGFSGTLPNGTPYNVPTYIPNAALVAAGGGGFLLTNVPGYYTDNHGVEVSLVKRLTDRWMGRFALSLNNARQHFASVNGIYDTNGNPTRLVTEPLINGGQFAPLSAGEGEGNIYTNARWQVNLNGMYEAPYGIQLAANIFGRQGYPEPLYRTGTTAALGLDSALSVLVSPTFDYIRYPSVWDTDIRAARNFKVGSATVRGMFDVFNLFNANTAIVRNGNIAATTFNQLAQNLSPLIARIGVQIGF